MAKQTTSPKTDRKSLKSEGFHDCEKVLLERDSNGVLTGIGKVIRSPKAVHQSNIDTFNSQQHNSGVLLRKKGTDYELVDVIVGKTAQGGKIVNLTRKMFVEKEKSADAGGQV